MSLELILIPLAVVAYGRWKVRAISQENVLLIETRLKDTSMLAQAIVNSGGLEVKINDGEVVALIDGLNISFKTDVDGILKARIDTHDVERATALILEVDRQYALLVQAAVVRRIQERANGLGLNLISQMMDDDGSINIILEEVKV